jgi:NDP-sugar pyrophosphorylase family protein
MDSVQLQPAGKIGKEFIPAEFLPNGTDEYYLRNSQNPSTTKWRNLSSDELETLVKNNNSADNWDEILVTEQFDPNQIQNTEFYGLVRIGTVQNAILEHHDLKLPIGIINSKIISCDIGHNVAIHNVSYLSHYIIGDRCILFNLDEMHTTNYAKFGNGIVKQGEPEKVRVWLDVMNETGCRRVIPFDGMLPADAYLWAKYRDDSALQKQLVEITQNQFDARRGYYGTVGEQCVIKNSRILKDVKIGSHCYIKGANKLKNLTINSTQADPSQIGEGVELVNGIIGYGCHAFYGVKAVRFILGDNSSLKYGARLINSFLGDNSTISCCEVLNNLIFPAHEQHHNNSFLIAAVVKGQSNMAAGATIGSNHNSRANDNELQAGRGFWPGLCSSIKHSSKFASYVLLAKSDFPAELNIPFPFSLLNNNESKNQLEIMPAYWWLYNMYALARNSWKFAKRDTRDKKLQHIEFDALAPDTVEEIFHARRLLEEWTGKAELLRANQNISNTTADQFEQYGREALNDSKARIDLLEICGKGMERSRRKAIILKAYDAYHAYGDMLLYYGVKNVLDYLESNPENTLTSLHSECAQDREIHWENLGGQLMSAHQADELRSDIGDKSLNSWSAIHLRYDELWESYPHQKQQHAYATLLNILHVKELSEQNWQHCLRKAIDIQNYICDQVYISRKKDFDNPFRQATFRNKDEMRSAIGVVEDNDFIKQVRIETEEFRQRVGAFITA